MHWSMVFLLALFMAVGKRRDDVLLKLSSGTDMRKSVKGYNLEFLNVATSLICAVIVVAYFMYTMEFASTHTWENSVEELSKRIIEMETKKRPARKDLGGPVNAGLL